MDILLKAGADVNIGYGPFQNPLLNLVSASYSNWVDKVKHFKSVTMLIKAGADVNAVTGNGETSLHYAAAFGCIDWMKALLEAGAVVNKCKMRGEPAPILASRGGHYKCVDMLLKAGADVNERNHLGNNALLCFLKYNEYSQRQLKCTKKLLRGGIHINIIDTYIKNKSALEMVLQYRNIQKQEDEENYRELVMLLYAAGEIVNDPVSLCHHSYQMSSYNMCDLLEGLNFEEEKLKLKHICREAIRKHLLKLDPHLNLFGRIPRLGLPNALNMYLLFNVSLEEEEGEI